MQHEVFIAGMFRSGTTLLGNLISAHPQGLVVSDPFIYFFKHYRDLHLRRLGCADVSSGEPTPDYFGGARRVLFDSLWAADLQEPLPRETLRELIADIRTWKAAQHPELCRRLDELRPGSFADVYRDLIALAVEVFREGYSRPLVAGTKVSWCEEFLPALARAFPDLRFVLPVRDLRAIVASQNNQSGAGAGRRPLLFYVRHWRKSVALAQHFLHRDPLLAGRVTLVRYEDLARAPEATLEPILRHVGLPALPQPVSVAALGDNSSFAREPGERGVFTASVERWRTALSTDEITAIEALAGPELALLGYPLEAPARRPLECLELACEPAFEQVSTWLQPCGAAAYLRDPALRRAEYAAEERRREVLEGTVAPRLEEQRDLFLVPGLWPSLHAAWCA